MRAHALSEEMQRYGCCALGNICYGTDAAADVRKQAAADAGAFALIVGDMRAHALSEGVQEDGCCALNDSDGDSV